MRTLDADLEDCLRRANPYVENYVEVSTPDVANVLRRPDQFMAPSVLAPAASIQVGANGALKIVPTIGALATFAAENSWFGVNGENEERRRKGLTWTVDAAFTRTLLRSFTARFKRYPLAGVFYLDLDFQLQIFRVTRTPGVRETTVRAGVQSSPFVQYAFTQVLSSPAVIKASAIAWGAPAGDSGEAATLTFDLSAYGVVLENTPGDATRPDYTGELPKYHFVITPIKHPKGTDYFRWMIDTATARDIAGVGHFERVFWARENEDAQWAETAQGDVPTATINVEAYANDPVATYPINLGRAPTAGAVGRIVFERATPGGSAASAELSTDAGASYLPVKHGDVVAVAQQNYLFRVTLTRGTANRSSPEVRAFGIEFRAPVDVSAESAVAWPTREIAVPWLVAAIPEGKLKVVRTGIRDYDDPASQLGAKYSPTKLEADVYLRSKHPSVTRDKWLRMERMSVTSRSPSQTTEEFSLLSYLHRLKRNIPEKKESVSTVHTVQAGSTAAQLVVAPNLPGVTVAGNELDGKHYYIRVPSTTKIEFVDGFVQEVAGNTNVNKLDFAPALPAVLNTGDTIELHSGVFGTSPIVWQDADPADVWWDLLTSYAAAIPTERIGHGSLPRGGLPPKVTDIEPGDATAQAKRKVTFAAREDEPIDELIDQVSFLMGGATIEVNGQIVFVQIYPLFSAAGVISVPLPPISRTFDPRDVSTPTTSPALESRTTVLTGIYGVNTAAANKDAYPERLTVGVDVDAVAWLTQQSLESVGNSELPEKISRWLYNSTDFGLYLTTQVISQVVRAGSTGLRVFGFNSIDAYPELTPGDVVALVTDQYTDYDPATAREIRGWVSVKGVLVRCGNGGRQFGMFVLGLADNVTTLKGLTTGSLAGTGEPPGIPLIVADFASDGRATITVFGGTGTVSAKIAASAVSTPLDAAVEATAPINGSIFSVTFTTPVIPPGGTIYLKLFEYSELDGLGVRSAPYPIAFQRPTGDTAQPPYADFQTIAESQTAMTHRLTGTLEPGDTAPLQYRYRIDAGGVSGAWSAWAAFPSGGGTYVDIVTGKSKFYPKVLVGQVRDSSSVPVESSLVDAPIMGQFESTVPSTGRIDATIPMSTTFTPFGYGGDTAAGVVATAARTFIDPGMVDGSLRVVNVYRAAATEPVGNLFKKGTDLASDVVTTATRTFVDPNAATQVDASGRIVGVYRLGVYEPVNNLVKAGDAFSPSSLSVGGDASVGGQLNVSGQGRFKAWYTTGTGAAAEAGISGGVAYFLGYNRTSSVYIDAYLQGLNVHLSALGGFAYFDATAAILTGGTWLSTDGNAYSRLWTPGVVISGTYGGTYGPVLTYLSKLTGGVWKSIAGGTPVAFTMSEGRSAISMANSAGTADVTLTWTDRFIVHTTGGQLTGGWNATGALTSDSSTFKFGTGVDDFYSLTSAALNSTRDIFGGQYPAVMSSHTGWTFTSHDSYGGFRIYAQAYPVLWTTATLVARFRASGVNIYSPLLLSNYLLLPTATPLYWDGGSDTYTLESAANVLDTYVGGAMRLRVYTGYVLVNGTDFIISATRKFYLDDGSDTYIDEVSANVLRFVTGGQERFKIQSQSLINTSSDATAGGMVFYTNGVALKGRVYWDVGGIGLLNDQDNWSIRCNYGSSFGGTLFGPWAITGALTLSTSLSISTTLSVTGAITALDKIDVTGAVKQKKGTATLYDTPTCTVSSSAAPGSASGYPTGHEWIQVTAPI